MAESQHVSDTSTTAGLPIAPSLSPTLQTVEGPQRLPPVTLRVLFLSAVAMVIGVAAALIAQVLTALIGLITNLSFYGRWSVAFVSPSENQLGMLVVAVPVVGGLIVGVMARYGSAAIRGHGIPEAMEQVLFNQSRIPPRLTFLKPLSAAISIGTGGPFGAEGPIIATGGALGSFVGQRLRISSDERKVLLSAGAAAGMTATFGAPVSSVLLAVELLLFEYRPRSIIPVALASVVATSVRVLLLGSAPMFPIPDVVEPSGAALLAYVVLGVAVGFAAVYVTRAVYALEDQFARLPFHWMWWPALGAIAVGLIGFLNPATLGVGYDNIERIVSGSLAGRALVLLCGLKLLSWLIALASGTSGGTLAPLFTIGGGLGALLGAWIVALWPGLGLDIRVAALVGMAAMFAGASRALLASIVFAFETTQQPLSLLPLLGGCTAAYLVSWLMMRESIMTEKIARRGARVRTEYAVDYLDQILVRDVALKPVATLTGETRVEEVRAWVNSHAVGSEHQGFPVVDGVAELVGVVTRRDIFDSGVSGERTVRDLISRSPVVAYDSSSLREAADHMVMHDVGRLPVVSRHAPRRIIGMLTRSDLLVAHQRRLDDARHDRRRYASEPVPFSR